MSNGNVTLVRASVPYCENQILCNNLWELALDQVGPFVTPRMIRECQKSLVRGYVLYVRTVFGFQE